MMASRRIRFPRHLTLLRIARRIGQSPIADFAVLSLFAAVLVLALCAAVS
jgi:hypothetical protein